MTQQKIDYNLSKKSIHFLREIHEKLDLSLLGAFSEDHERIHNPLFLSGCEKKVVVKDCKRIYKALLYDMENYSDEYHGIPYDEWIQVSGFISFYIKEWLTPFIINYPYKYLKSNNHSKWLENYIALSEETSNICQRIKEILSEDNKNKKALKEEITIEDLKHQLQDKEEDIIFFKERIKELQSVENCIKRLEDLGLSDAICKYIVTETIGIDADIEDSVRGFMDERHLNYKAYLLKALQYYPEEVLKTNNEWN